MHDSCSYGARYSSTRGTQLLGSSTKPLYAQAVWPPNIVPLHDRLPMLVLGWLILDILPTDHNEHLEIYPRTPASSPQFPRTRN